MQTVRQLAFCSCFFLAAYVGLGSRAWDYALGISNPLTDFIIAATYLGAIVALGSKAGVPVLIFAGALVGGLIQLSVDSLPRSLGWPEAVYLMSSLSILAMWVSRDGGQQGRPAVNAILILVVGFAFKSLTVVRPGVFGDGGLYSLQFMLTWGLLLFGTALLAREVVGTIARKVRPLSPR